MSQLIDQMGGAPERRAGQPAPVGKADLLARAIVERNAARSTSAKLSAEVCRLTFDLAIAHQSLAAAHQKIGTLLVGGGAVPSGANPAP